MVIFPDWLNTKKMYLIKSSRTEATLSGITVEDYTNHYHHALSL